MGRRTASTVMTFLGRVVDRAPDGTNVPASVLNQQFDARKSADTPKARSSRDRDHADAVAAAAVATAKFGGHT